MISTAVACLGTPAYAGPISLSMRVQKEFFKAQAVVTTRLVPCFKTDPTIGAQTMSMCTETVPVPGAGARLPAGAAPPPPPKPR